MLHMASGGVVDNNQCVFVRKEYIFVTLETTFFFTNHHFVLLIHDRSFVLF